MTNRVLLLQTALLNEIDNYAVLIPHRDETPEWEKLHMASSARLAWLMAMERGVDPELAACACSAHDYGRIVTGKQKDHAKAGYLPIKQFLMRFADLFSPSEREIIAQAVKNHSDKNVVGTPIEEIVKDADVVDCFQYGAELPRPEQRARYDRWLASRSR
jgi:uncharacterized protein